MMFFMGPGQNGKSENFYKQYLINLGIDPNMIEKMSEAEMKDVLGQIEKDVDTILEEGGSMQDVITHIRDTVNTFQEGDPTPFEMPNMMEDELNKFRDHSELFVDKSKSIDITDRILQEQEEKPAINRDQIMDLRIVLSMAKTIDDLLAVI